MNIKCSCLSYKYVYIQAKYTIEISDVCVQLCLQSDIKLENQIGDITAHKRQKILLHTLFEYTYLYDKHELSKSIKNGSKLSKNYKNYKTLT